MSDEKYNGWTNYETWAVNLWLDNEESSQNLMQEFKDYAKQNPLINPYMTLERRIVNTLADEIKEYVEDSNPLGDNASLYTDLLNASLSQVDYIEIAENLLQD